MAHHRRLNRRRSLAADEALNDLEGRVNLSSAPIRLPEPARNLRYGFPTRACGIDRQRYGERSSRDAETRNQHGLQTRATASGPVYDWNQHPQRIRLAVDSGARRAERRRRSPTGCSAAPPWSTRWSDALAADLHRTPVRQGWRYVTHQRRRARGRRHAAGWPAHRFDGPACPADRRAWPPSRSRSQRSRSGSPALALQISQGNADSQTARRAAERPPQRRLSGDHRREGRESTASVAQNTDKQNSPSNVNSRCWSASWPRF